MYVITITGSYNGVTIATVTFDLNLWGSCTATEASVTAHTYATTYYVVGSGNLSIPVYSNSYQPSNCGLTQTINSVVNAPFSYDSTSK